MFNLKRQDCCHRSKGAGSTKTVGTGAGTDKTAGTSTGGSHQGAELGNTRAGLRGTQECWNKTGNWNRTKYQEQGRKLEQDRQSGTRNQRQYHRNSLMAER